MDRLDEVTLVHARIMERLECKYDDAIQRHDAVFSRLEGALEKLISGVQETNEAVEKTNAEVQIMNSAMNGLFERMDRFIQGRDSNGHKPGGKKE